MTEKKVIAFKLGTTKRSAVLDTTRHIDKKNNHFDDATHDVEKREYIVGIDDKEVKSLVPPVEKQILIIPVQQNEHQKFFKLKQSLRERIKPKPSEKTTATITENEIEQLDVEARRLLQLDAQLANEVWNERTENGHPRVERIDVDTVNTFATLLTADGQDKHEAQKEEEVEQADYDQVSIDEFGMAVLRGMGFKEDIGIGLTNKKAVATIELQSRPRGLGLGADRKILEKINQLKKNQKKDANNNSDEKELCYENGACVLIEKGRYCDLYGKIQSIDEDLARITVVLAIGKKDQTPISLSQYNVKLVTEKEYIKYSKYVNKTIATKLEKESNEQMMENYTKNGSDSRRHRDKSEDKPEHRKHDDHSDEERHHRHHHHHHHHKSHRHHRHK